MEAFTEHPSLLHCCHEYCGACLGEQRHTRGRRGACNWWKGCRSSNRGEPGNRTRYPLQLKSILSTAHNVLEVSFTGSEHVGRVVGKTVMSRFGKTILELGGNNGR